MEYTVGDPVQVVGAEHASAGLSDARDSYEGMLAGIIELDEERELVKLRFDDGCFMWFKEVEIDHV